MTKKQKYIGAFLDGYFIDKEFNEYGKEYIFELENANNKAKKKWKQHKKQFKQEGL